MNIAGSEMVTDPDERETQEERRARLAKTIADGPPDGHVWIRYLWDGPQFVLWRRGDKDSVEGVHAVPLLLVEQLERAEIAYSAAIDAVEFSGGLVT